LRGAAGISGIFKAFDLRGLCEARAADPFKTIAEEAGQVNVKGRQISLHPEREKIVCTAENKWCIIR
jgi:hypothetical protein